MDLILPHIPTLRPATDREFGWMLILTVSRHPSEPGVAGVSVILSFSIQKVLKLQEELLTDWEIIFLKILMPENIRFSLIYLPAIHLRRWPDSAQDGFDSDADITTGRTQAITLALRDRDMTVDAGLVAPGNLHGLVILYGLIPMVTDFRMRANQESLVSEWTYIPVLIFQLRLF